MRPGNFVELTKGITVKTSVAQLIDVGHHGKVAVRNSRLPSNRFFEERGESVGAQAVLRFVAKKHIS